jgi:hypothetical protein
MLRHRRSLSAIKNVAFCWSSRNGCLKKIRKGKEKKHESLITFGGALCGAGL